MAYKPKTKTVIEKLCPYYYRKCTLKQCDQRASSEEVLAGFDVWMNHINKLKACPSAGAELSIQEYRSRQERIVVK